MNVKKSDLQKAINKAYVEAHKWCKINRWHTYAMMLDTDDAEIWSDCFPDENTWRRYRSASIHKLSPDLTLAESSYECRQRYLDNAMSILNDAGWTITD